jgi:hypothetical protein
MGTNNQPKFENLCRSLSEELQLYDDLINAMKTKQKAIVNGENKTIKSAIFKEQEISQYIIKQMDKRNKITQTISLKTEQNSEKMTLTHLINRASSKFKQRLEDIRKKMHLSVLEIDKINRENKYLLSASISHVKDLVNVFLTHGKKIHNHYGVNGSMRINQKENRVLDFKI